MISSHETDEEVVLVSVEQHEARSDNTTSWVDDMKTFLVGNGYSQGLENAKRR